MQPTPDAKADKVEPTRIHARTEVGTVTLKVADLARSLDFYTQAIGLQITDSGKQTATLGAGERPVMLLEEVPGAKPQPTNTTGLYHAAILFPDRRSLAIKIAQFAAEKREFGYSDHLVSEAFYLSDPDGNGLELYRDRPRSEWTWRDGQVQMALDPIDFDNFFAEIGNDASALANRVVPVGTKLGHVHLRVGDIPTAEKFYHGVLGFDVVAKMPGALFVSAGGYHHHLGMNTWESRGGHAPIEPSAGLREFTIVVPDQAELGRLAAQIEAAGTSVERTPYSIVVRDPWQNQVRIVCLTDRK